MRRRSMMSETVVSGGGGSITDGMTVDAQYTTGTQIVSVLTGSGRTYNRLTFKCNINFTSSNNGMLFHMGNDDYGVALSFDSVNQVLKFTIGSTVLESGSTIEYDIAYASIPSGSVEIVQVIREITQGSADAYTYANNNLIGSSENKTIRDFCRTASDGSYMATSSTPTTFQINTAPNFSANSDLFIYYNEIPSITPAD